MPSRGIPWIIPSADSSPVCPGADSAGRSGERDEFIGWSAEARISRNVFLGMETDEDDGARLKKPVYPAEAGYLTIHLERLVQRKEQGEQM